ncbi:MAG: antitoxin MazE family protein [Nitrospirae bacterium]|nr:antitoxin MazE family protein [Nitrospirota bacterium]
MKLLRIRVPDIHSPEFAKEAERQSALLRNDSQENEVLQFIEKVADFSGWQP